MHPVLFELGPLTIYFYGVLVALAFVCASIWAVYRANLVGENGDLYLQAIIWIVIAGFVGGRLMYVVYFPEYYMENPLKILTDRGGLVWYGGLLLASLTAIGFAKWKRLSLFRYGDILSAPTALGLAIGRVGCFMTGCCYGSLCKLPWAVTFPAGHATHPHPVHPTQLYETMALLVFIGGLEWVWRRHRVATPGLTMGLFFMGIGVIRFVLEFFRGEAVFWVADVLSASQVMSLVGILVGIGVTVAALRRQSRQSAELSS